MKRKTVLLLKHQKVAILVSAGLIVAASCAFGALVTSMFVESSECVNAKAKLQIGNEFCASLAIKMVEEQCSGLEPQVSEECRSMVHSFISDSCANYIGLERLSSESISLCD
jgi:hypothetical protein